MTAYEKLPKKDQELINQLINTTVGYAQAPDELTRYKNTCSKRQDNAVDLLAKRMGRLIRQATLVKQPPVELEPKCRSRK